MQDAVRIQMRSDVPVGLFLSSGVDSGTLLALMRQHTNEPIHTFTIGFEDGAKTNETDDARIFADRLGADHTQRIVTSNDYEKYFERYLWDGVEAYYALIAEARAMGLLTILPWRGVLAVLGLASLGWGIFFARRGQGGYFPGMAPNLGSLSTLAKLPSFWIMMFLFCMGVGGSLGVYSMMPLYLVSERHMDQETANLWVALSRLTGLGMAFVAGWASDRLGPKRAMTGVLILAGLSTLGLGMTSGGWLLPSSYVPRKTPPNHSTCRRGQYRRPCWAQ